MTPEFDDTSDIINPTIETDIDPDTLEELSTLTGFTSSGDEVIVSE